MGLGFWVWVLGFRVWGFGVSRARYPTSHASAGTANKRGVAHGGQQVPRLRITKV